MKSALARSFACSLVLLTLAVGCRTPQQEPVTPLSTPVVTTAPVPVSTNNVIPMPDVEFGHR